MVSSVGMFSGTNPAASTQWKSVTAGAGTTTSSTWAAATGAKDSVSVSKLGQALSGMAADVFSHLDDKTRSTLETIVEQGVLSADEVVDGLKAYGKDALFNRYLGERTPTAEERASQQKQADDWAALQSYERQHHAVRKEQTDRMTAAQAQYNAGSITWDEMSTAWHDATAAAQEKIATFKDQRPERNTATEVKLSPAFAEFAALDFGDGDPESNMVTSLASSGARAKLMEQIVPLVKNFGDALKRFASDYTMPVPGVPATASATTSAAGQIAASGVPTGPAPTAPGPTGTTPAATASATPAVSGHTTNAQAAISLLQSAAGGAKPTSTTATSPDASLEALLKALKSGIGTRV